MYATSTYSDRASILHTTVAGWVDIFHGFLSLEKPRHCLLPSHFQLGHPVNLLIGCADSSKVSKKKKTGENCLLSPTSSLEGGRKKKKCNLYIRQANSPDQTTSLARGGDNFIRKRKRQRQRHTHTEGGEKNPTTSPPKKNCGKQEKLG